MDQKPTNDSWARRLRMARAGANLTQAALAEKSGVHFNTVRSVEYGNPVNDEAKIKLAAALGVEVAELFPYDLYPREVAR